MKIILEFFSVNEKLPRGSYPVLVTGSGPSWRSDANILDAALYGNVWRDVEGGEDQIFGITHWAEMPILKSYAERRAAECMGSR